MHSRLDNTLDRCIEQMNDVLGRTARYYYDGVKEVVETDGAGDRQRYYVHGISYVDERLMMFSDEIERAFYYVINRMYNVRFLVDRAGAVVERPARDATGEIRSPASGANAKCSPSRQGYDYDGYGRPNHEDHRGIRDDRLPVAR